MHLGEVACEVVNWLKIKWQTFLLKMMNFCVPWYREICRTRLYYVCLRKTLYCGRIGITITQISIFPCQQLVRHPIAENVFQVNEGGLWHKIKFCVSVTLAKRSCVYCQRTPWTKIILLDSNSISANRDIPRLLRNPKVDGCISRSPKSWLHFRFQLCSCICTYRSIHVHPVPTSLMSSPK